MEQGRHDSLIGDAELVADAAVFLGKLKDHALLDSISGAKRAVDGETRETAFRALQFALADTLRLLDPITLFDLKNSWELNCGFHPKKLQLYFFWLLSVALLVFVGYTTSLYQRATSIAQTLTELENVRLSEQGVKLYDLARIRESDIVKLQTPGQPPLELETFFHALGDIREIENRINSATIAAASITSETKIWSRALYSLCFLPNEAFKLIKVTLCVDSEDPNYYPAALGPRKDPSAPYPSTPTLLGSVIVQKQVVALTQLNSYMDEADKFFVNIGVGEFIGTRTSPLVNDFTIRDIKYALDGLRSWWLPGAYGALGAAIFFMRRFFNPLLPNPDSLRVIYRVLFGGFAGIIFAWFWTPLQPAGDAVAISSLSPFTIAFLAGYGTDILFQLLDRLVDLASQQFRKPPTQVT